LLPLPDGHRPLHGALVRIAISERRHSDARPRRRPRRRRDDCERQAAFEKNEFGDELIVSHAVVEVDQNLKGSAPTAFVDVDVEGGTVGELTLKVSDLPSVERGDRGVFFLKRRGSSEFTCRIFVASGS
jgi:hypothetical protein